MKFSSAFPILFLAATAAPGMSRNIPPSEELQARLLRAGPNAQRLARGLPPLPPTRLRAHSAKKATTSSTPPTVTCTSQTTVCCGSLEASTSTDAISVLQSLGLTPTSANVGAMIGVACVVPVIVLGKKSCPTATAPASCCNTLLGLVGFSCTTTTLTTS